MTTYGSTARVRSLTGIKTDEVTDDEIASLLEEATRSVEDDFGAFYTEINPVSLSRDGVIREFELKFKHDTSKAIEPRCYVNKEELDSADFSITGRFLTLVDSVRLSQGDEVTIRYIPTTYTDLANYNASKNLLLRSISISQGGANETHVRNIISSEEKKIRARLERNLVVSTWIDAQSRPGVW